MITGNTALHRIYNEIFIQSWWVILFAIICYMCLEQGLKKRDHDYTKLHLQLEELKQDLHYASEHQKTLNFKLESRTDSMWIELVLMKELGLVPEGQTKIFFKGS